MSDESNIPERNLITPEVSTEANPLTQREFNLQVVGQILRQKEEKLRELIRTQMRTVAILAENVS